MEIPLWQLSPHLKTCGSSMSVNKKIIIVRPDELLDSTRINIIFRTGSRFLASGFLGSLANSGDWISRYPMENRLVWGAARPLRACYCWSRSKQSEWRIQYQASAWRSARKLQTLGKCSSTNLESFTFRLLTQPTQGVFLRSASIESFFDSYFIKKWTK